ncbi:MAG: aminotransferase class III-fold pyridoxal phosphate-dependent enzyme [Bacteroidales bacterium]
MPITIFRMSGISTQRWWEAGQKQMALSEYQYRYLHDQLTEYAERLLAKFPEPLQKVFFVNSGSAASDLAIRSAQTHTRNQGLVVMEHGYHGHTRLGVDISHYKFGGKRWIWSERLYFKVPIPDTLSRGNSTIRMQVSIMQTKSRNCYESNNSPVAAFIAEPIVGCGGQVPLASGYLKEVILMIRKQEAFRLDEVQTDYWIGTHFWVWKPRCNP